MRVERLKVDGQGIKGRAFEHHMAPVTLFHGPNGSGKTARLLAIEVARVGLADVPTDSLRPYLGPTKPDATVNLLWSDGAWTKRASALGSRTKEAAKATAEAAVRFGPYLAKVDLSDVAVGPDSTRADLLRRVLEAHQVGIPATDVLARVERSSEAVKALRAFQKERSLPKAAEQVSQWIDDMVVYAEAKASFWGERLRELNAAVRQSIGAGSDLRALEVIEQDILALERQKAAYAAASEVADSILRGRSAHEALGAQLTERVGLLEAERVKTQRIHDELKATWGARERAVVVLRNRATDAARAVAKGAEELEVAEKNLEAAVAALSSSIQAVGEAAARAGLLGELLGKDGFAGEPCKDCGAVDPLNLESAKKTADAMFRRLTSLANLRKEEHATARAQREQARAALDGAERVKACLAQDVVRAEGKLSIDNNAQASAAERLAKLRAELEEMDQKLREWQAAEPPSLPETMALDGAEALEAIAARRAELEQEKRSVIGAKEEEARLLKKQEERDQASAAVATARALVKAAREARQWMSEQAFQPLTAAANEWLRAGGYGATFYISAASDFGFEREGLRVVFWALSDSERAMCALAMGYAMAVCTSAPWKGMVVDGMERMDEGVMGCCLRAAVDLWYAGKLDNFIGATVWLPSVVPDGVSVVELR